MGTLVYIIADNLEDAIAKLNEDLKNLYKKLCQFFSKLNVGKTKANIYINSSKLEIVKEIKYLGVQINDNLSFDKNKSHICKKKSE